MSITTEVETRPVTIDLVPEFWLDCDHCYTLTGHHVRIELSAGIDPQIPWFFARPTIFRECLRCGHRPISQPDTVTTLSDEPALPSPDFVVVEIGMPTRMPTWVFGEQAIATPILMVHASTRLVRVGYLHRMRSFTNPKSDL